MFPTEPPNSNNGFRALLKNRGFMLLWIGQVFSQLADKVLLVLLIALLQNYKPIPGMKTSMYSTLMVAFTIPAVLFGSAGGIFVDRFSKKQILLGSDVLRGLLTLCVSFLPRDFLILLILTFGISTVTQFFAPAEQAAIPLLVRRENLMTANALFSSTMMGAIIIGFAVGEPILSLAKTWNSDYGQEFVVASLYLVSAAMIQLINFKEPLPQSNALSTVRPWDDFTEGLRYLSKNRLILNAMFQLTTLYCVFAALMVLSTGLANKFGLEARHFGFFLAATGVGLVFGAGILGHLSEKLRRLPLSLIGFLIIAFVLGVLNFINYLPLGLGLSALLGVGASLIGVPMQTLIQQQTPPSMHGKVFGFQNHAVNIALSVPLAVTGFLNDNLGLPTLLVGMSFTVTVIGVWAWYNTRHMLQDFI